jgi:hypothetical protein
MAPECELLLPVWAGLAGSTAESLAACGEVALIGIGAISGGRRGGWKRGLLVGLGVLIATVVANAAANAVLLLIVAHAARASGQSAPFW